MTEATSKWRSRKFGVCAATGLLSSVFLIGGFIDGQQWVNLQITIIGAYNLANAYSGRR